MCMLNGGLISAMIAGFAVSPAVFSGGGASTKGRGFCRGGELDRNEYGFGVCSWALGICGLREGLFCKRWVASDGSMPVGTLLMTDLGRLNWLTVGSKTCIDCLSGGSSGSGFPRKLKSVPWPSSTLDFVRLGAFSGLALFLVSSST